MSSVDNYCGISINPIISKLFEQGLLRLYQKYMVSSRYQLGFKKNIACSHAHFMVEKTVNYFLERGSSVNLCSIDISKAFDKVNRYILFDKLLIRNCPAKFIMILQCWLSKSFTSVKWNGYFSDFISLYLWCTRS